MAYSIYLRKSRADAEAEARGEGETLVRHERALLDLAKGQKLNITKIYRELVSGETIAARPVMQQLLSEVEQDSWEGVLVMEVERLARGDTMDQGLVAQVFKYSNTKIITPMKTYNPNNEFDEEYFEFGLFMSRREYKTINRRLQNGRIASVKEGKYLAPMPPYGYTRKKLEGQKGYTLEVNPDQAEVVKYIFDLYTKGEEQSDGTYKRFGVSLIVRKLNDLRISSMKGDVWVTSTIQGMLRNPIYIGKIRWNARPQVKKISDGQMEKIRPRAKEDDWILVEGLHEAIIDDETWMHTQENLLQNKPLPVPRGKEVKNPLAGLVVCGICNRKMVRRPYGGKHPESIMCSVTSCNNVSSQLSIVEEQLIRALHDWLKKFKIDLDIGDGQAIVDGQIDLKKKAQKNIEEEIKVLQKQKDNIYDYFEQGIYTADMFLERSSAINEKIVAATRNFEMLQRELKEKDRKVDIQKNIVPKIEKVLELYSQTDNPDMKNRLLKEVLEKVVYTKTVNGRWHHRPDDFTLKLYPRVPE